VSGTPWTRTAGIGVSYARDVGESIGASRRRSRTVARIDEPVTAPSDSPEPRLRPRYRRSIRAMRHANRTPAGEPCGRRAGIASGHGAEMLPEIHQDVHEGVAHGAWRRESAGVIPVTEDASSAPECVIHRTRYPDGQSSKATCQAGPVCSLCDEVDVVLLDAELDHAEPTARRRRARGSYHREESAERKQRRASTARRVT